MKVSELIRQLKMADPEAFVQFHDVTYNRDCPVNSARESKGHNGHKTVILTNGFRSAFV